jgi:flagellar protein FliL
MAEAAATPENSAPAAGKKSKSMLFVGIAILALLLGAGGAWFMLKGKPSAQDDEHARQKARAKAELEHVFLPLDAFVVNLQPAGSEQYLQTEITLRLADLNVSELAKKRMPEIRNRVLMLLSTKTAQVLTTPNGKAALAEAIRREISAVIDPTAARAEQKQRARTIDPEDREPGSEESSAAADPSAVAEGEKDHEPAAEEAPKENHEPAPPSVLAVLFTSFIIQ